MRRDHPFIGGNPVMIERDRAVIDRRTHYFTRKNWLGALAPEASKVF